MSIDQAPAASIPTFDLAVEAEMQREVEQFLFFEARLLDERRFSEWYDLFSDDVHYWMPARYNRLLREMDKEVAGPGEIANFDEDKRSLGQRVFRINTGMAWAEDPPSRTRHLVTNVLRAARGGGRRVRGRIVFHHLRQLRQRGV